MSKEIEKRSNFKDKVVKGFAKGIMRSMKVAGIRLDDIIDIISDLNIDAQFGEYFKQLAKKNNCQNITMISYYNETTTEFCYRIVELLQADDGNIVIGKTIPVSIFGVETEYFNLMQLIKFFINKALEYESIGKSLQ